MTARRPWCPIRAIAHLHASVPWCHRHDALPGNRARSSSASSSRCSSSPCSPPAGSAWRTGSRPTRSIGQDREVRPGTLDDVGRGEPANFLIIGSDTRAFVDNATDEEHFGDPAEQTGQRSDTIMVAHIDPDTETGVLVSFPRDLWVDIPGTRRAPRSTPRSTAARSCVVETIKQNFDIPISHYLEVDFAGLPQHRRRDRHGADLLPDAGARHQDRARHHRTRAASDLDGDEALAYVRSRYYEYFERTGSGTTTAPSDLGRIRRQQYFIRSLANEAVKSGLPQLHEGQRHPRQDGRRTSRATRTSGSPTSARSAQDVPRGRSRRRRDGDRADRRASSSTARTRWCSIAERGRADLRPAARRSASRPRRTSCPQASRRPTSRVAVLNGSGVGGPGRRRVRRAAAAPGSRSSARPATPTAATTTVTEVRYADGREDQGAVRARVPRRRGQARRGRRAARRAPTSCVVLGRDFHGVSVPDDDADGRDRRPRLADDRPPAPTTVTGPPAELRAATNHSRTPA